MMELSIKQKKELLRITAFVIVLCVIAWFLGEFQSRPRQIRQPETSSAANFPQHQVDKSPSIDGAQSSAREAEKARAEQELAAQRALQDAAAKQSNYLARYLNSDVVRTADTKLVAVAISDGTTFNQKVSRAIIDRLRGKELQLTTSLLTQEFIADGLFNEALSNPGKILKSLEFSKRADAVLFGKLSVDYATNPSLNNLITATAQLDLFALPANPAQEGDHWTFSVSGAGFNNGAAKLMAEERLIKEIGNRTNLSLTTILASP